MDIKSARNEMSKIEKNVPKKQPQLPQQEIGMLNKIIEEGERKACISEWYFVKYFLPLFYNILKKNIDVLNNENASYLLQKWLFISGSQYNSVNVLDDKGDIIYTIPPLLMYVDLTSRFRNVDMTDLCQETEKLNKWIDGKGDNLLQSVLGKGDIAIDKPLMGKYAKEWYNIFKRYGHDSDDTPIKEDDTLDLDYD